MHSPPNFRLFHGNSHPTIGDMLYLKAEIMIKRGNLIEAQSVLADVLSIYRESFEADSPKIRGASEKLRAIANK